ncbi:hypothetical protein EOA75_09685 [Mesorhizobium sp. M1A.F.Ca.IN.022.07.1.1]|nr:hypothetical protein EOA75_09685 [Mesorhizobium sp. M1A.F.Ca.IN.022.07.1.1]RWM65123.1 MAG: hypothetical protein EOR82_31175 [Mesorhizobium sp.]RWM89585.1 MAG: hypothetical protein EOR86_29580 [Mesorhizobium sp.]TIS71598.1 MAG: hypothetical protein E5X11_00470 [Mesorhizobium sp.]TJV54609.1 MAG: hypothetical protein E5X82_31015 [Mesorhizobium sp.]
MRQWARRGTRPRQPADQRYKSAYLFGAICPARGIGAGLALPFADTEAMQLHLDEISRHVASAPRPCYCSIAPTGSQTWLSNRVFEGYDAIIDAACEAWRKLLTQPETINSIGMREGAHVGQSK